MTIARMSPIGTKQTYRDSLLFVRFWGKADITYIVDRATGRFVMAKKRRVYKPQLVGGKVMMPRT